MPRTTALAAGEFRKFRTHGGRVNGVAEAEGPARRGGQGLLLHENLRDPAYVRLVYGSASRLAERLGPVGPAALEQAKLLTRLSGGSRLAQPSVATMVFPHRQDTLNRSDDPMHVTVLPDGDAAGLLRELGFVILDRGRTRLARNLVLMPVKVDFSPWLGVTGPMLWDLYGFEEYAVVRIPRADGLAGAGAFRAPRALRDARPPEV